MLYLSIVANHVPLQMPITCWWQWDQLQECMQVQLHKESPKDIWAQDFRTTLTRFWCVWEFWTCVKYYGMGGPTGPHFYHIYDGFPCKRCQTKKPVFGKITERRSNFQFKICIILYFSCSAHTSEISDTDFYKFYKWYEKIELSMAPCRRGGTTEHGEKCKVMGYVTYRL